MKLRRDIVVRGLRRRLLWLLPLGGHHTGISFLLISIWKRICEWLKSQSLHTVHRERE